MEERFENPQCACGNRGARPGSRIEIGRVRERLDQLQDAGDSAGAERLLDYWLAEARQAGDQTGEILIENEYVGFFRKTDRGDEALAHGERGMALLAEAGMEDTVTAATTRINLATACVAFRQPERGMKLFREARELYERLLKPEDSRLAGLYNNMGLCAAELGAWTEGRELFRKALAMGEKTPEGKGEAAITCLNMADLVSAEYAEAEDEESLTHAAEEIDALTERAWRLLNAEDLPRDDYYRFICGKCAPVFGYYGCLEYQEELEKRSVG